MASKFKMNDGDWICSDSQCSNVNFARRSTCNRCGKEKTDIPSRKKLGHEIGKAAAEKSRGLFSADDWQCGRCGNVNWARRQTCNMCNAPKFGEVEERTGLGGGYNERENVEYIEREDSDGEFDEFGRKKKKFRKDDPPAKSELQAKKEENTVSQFEDEEEEEEEDDEDGDLSKYDLSGWGDNDVDEETGDKAIKVAKKRSNSSTSSNSSSSSSHSRSSSEKYKNKRRHFRSSSNSSENRKRTKHGSSSRSPSSSPRSRSRDRSKSHSPIGHKE